MKHMPVMQDEILKYFEPCDNGLIIDGTLGLGGHSEALLASYTRMNILGLDLDENALIFSGNRLNKYGDRIKILKDNFSNILPIMDSIERSELASGLLLDLGVSSYQLDTPERGFSFRFDAPLDMRFNSNQEIKASDVINEYSERELADLIYKYGEERKSRKIAKAIIDRRPIFTTMELADLIKNIIGAKNYKIHPATKTFQALRIEVNKELNNLYSALSDSLKIIKNKGRIIVISYHSLEDRIVKSFFKNESKKCICPVEVLICECHHSPMLKVITKRVHKPSFSEINANPRSRSAKMRVAELISGTGY
ncbi:MAG: 16S rRNA (cytosine(1402)-N(4))-methyltransferase [Chloroflexi bacterium]|nr:16S rRNA (cytosine(1402)-N(4))-methyltransferase [Chloroflexota bacterium]|tara:strand:- start:108187 stop:109116 length:930 start_codon:yes stop_codon:yes gene_type:complete